MKDLDFYSGTVDGISGPNTRKAIQAYQQKVGLSASGEIDSALLDQLGATPTTAAVVPRPEPRAGPDRTPVPVSLPADASAQAPDPRIVKIQAGLKAFGNDDMQLDGVVGPRTKAAIREFQSLFGLPADRRARRGGLCQDARDRPDQLTVEAFACQPADQKAIPIVGPML